MPKGIRTDRKSSPLLGRPRPQQVIDRITTAWTEEKRAKRSRQYSGAGNPNFGKKHSKETRQKISKAVQLADTPERRERMSEAAKAYGFSGSRNGNWKGGRWSLWIYPHEFNVIKESIRERDNHICQHCGIANNETNNYELDVHHMDGNRFNNDPNNLITLCRSCHKFADAKLKAGREVVTTDART